jgi:hypothetical protein
MLLFAVYTYPNLPFPSVPMNANVAGSVVTLFTAIAAILTTRRRAEIALAIIYSIAIYVVALLKVYEAHPFENHAMHAY